MSEAWIVVPHTRRLELAGGQWLKVKAELNTGETLDLFSSAAPGLDLTQGINLASLDPLKVGPALVVAYLLDWSLTGPDGAPVPIAGLSDAEKLARLRLLTFDGFSAIMNAIVAHDAAIRREKKVSTAPTASADPSPSRAVVAGAMSG